MVPACFRSRWSGPASRWLLSKKLRIVIPVIAVSALLIPSLRAQTIDDGVMVTKNTIFSGVQYSHDSWDHYWEGTLKRDNGNIGTLTTQTSTWTGNYGITNRFNLLAAVPYVWTHASQGVLHNMSGFQDLTVGLKYSFLETPLTKFGHLRAIAVGTGSIPLTNYTPDFLPLSIGSHSKRLGARFTLNFQTKQGWYLNGTTAYTWRGNVTLNRSSYYTNGQLFLTNKVEMPNIFDYTASVGYMKHGWMIPFNFTQQRTQGGGDIRRQDAPFVSNQMNFSRIGGMVMYDLHFFGPRTLSPMFSFNYIIDGRNVGQSKTYTFGLMYRFNFEGRPTI